MTGIRSSAVKRRPHAPQCESGVAMDREAGNRSATTLMKLPIETPSNSQKRINMMEVD
jgi:hypothetical protein